MIDPKDKKKSDEALKPKPGEGETPVEKTAEEIAAEEAAAAEAQEPPKPAKEDPLLAALMKDLGENVPEIKPLDEKTPEEKAAEEKAAAEAAKKLETKAAAETPPPKNNKKKGVIVELPKETILPPLPAATPPAKPAEPEKKPEKPAEDADAEYVSGLTDEQKEELAEAEMAEKMYPEKYKGRKAKLVAWYKKFDDDVQGIIKNNPDAKALDDVDEFKKLVGTKPKLDTADYKRVQRKMGADEGAQTVRQELTPKLTEIERRQNEVEFRPKVEAAKKSFVEGVRGLFDGDEQSPMSAVHKLHLEKGEAEVAKEFPLEHQIAKEELGKRANMVDEYLMFTRGLRQFDETNKTHTDLLDFINTQTKDLLDAGAKEPSLLLNNGKRFLSREDYMRVKQTQPQEVQKYWTYGHQDILEMLALDAKNSIENRIRAEDTRLKGLGYERKKPAAAKPAEVKPHAEPTPKNPPKATPKPSKGAGVKPGAGSAAVEQPKGDPLDVVSTLRLKD